MTKNQHPDKFSRMKKQMRSTNRNLRGEYEMFEELEAYRDIITWKGTTEDIEAEQICNELDLNEEEE